MKAAGWNRLLNTRIVFPFAASVGLGISVGGGKVAELSREDGEVAGKVTLLALASAVDSTSADYWSYRVRGDDEYRSLDMAAVEMANLPKPTRCRGKVSGPGLLDVDCSLLSTIGVARHAGYAARVYDRLRRTIASSCDVKEADITFTVHVADRALAMSPVAFEGWVHDYVLTYELGLIDTDCSQQGRVVAHVELKPNGGTFLLTKPPDEPPD